MPTDDGQSASPADNSTKANPGIGAAPSRSAWPSATFAALEALAKWLDVLRKIAISFAVVAGVIIAIILIGRSLSQEGIVIDQVIVQWSDPKDGPTSELAALEIAKHIDAIQRAGVSEWRKLYVGQTSNPIDLQIPGSPFTLRGGMRQLAGLVGIKPPTIRASIVSPKASTALVASVGIEGDPASQAACEDSADAKGMDRLIDCIALHAISFIDPKVAASYVFHAEERNCRSLDPGPMPDAGPMDREQKLIENRRGRCDFSKTQALIAKTLERGRAEDLPWVPYVYGKVHLARAAAVAGLDREEELGELDQAIGRFGDSQRQMPNSLSAIAVLFEAYVKKGIAIHQVTTTWKWDDDAASRVQWHLYLAEATFADAVTQLKRIPPGREPTLDALVHRLEGQLYYRQWMIKAHRRTKSGELTVAIGQPDELALLRQASASLEAAARNTRPVSLFMDWGNVLRAAGDFDGAAGKYLQAADLSPDYFGPRLNLAIAYLDRVIYGKLPAEPIHVLVGLGAASNYLTWVSGGDPVPNLQKKLEDALAATGFPEDRAKFMSCQEAVPAPETDRWKSLAGRKSCIDRAIQQVNERVIRTPRAPVKASAK